MLAEGDVVNEREPVAHPEGEREGLREGVPLRLAHAVAEVDAEMELHTVADAVRHSEGDGERVSAPEALRHKVEEGESVRGEADAERDAVCVADLQRETVGDGVPEAQELMDGDCDVLRETVKLRLPHGEVVGDVEDDGDPLRQSVEVGEREAAPVAQ